MKGNVKHNFHNMYLYDFQNRKSGLLQIKAYFSVVR